MIDALLDALILLETSALYKLFTYLPTYLLGILIRYSSFNSVKVGLKCTVAVIYYHSEHSQLTRLLSMN